MRRRPGCRDLVVDRQAVRQPSLPSETEPHSACASTRRVAGRGQLHRRPHPVDHLPATEATECVQRLSLGDSCTHRRVAGAVGAFPCRPAAARPRCGPHAAQPDSPEPRCATARERTPDVPGEGLGLDQVAGTGHRVNRPEQPLLAMSRSGLSRLASTSAHAAPAQAPPPPHAAQTRRGPRRGPDRRGDGDDAMPQCRRLVVDETGRHGVQLDAPRRAELLVHGGLHQRMAEPTSLMAKSSWTRNRFRSTASSRASTGFCTSASTAAADSETVPPRTAAASTSRRAPGLHAFQSRNDPHGERTRGRQNRFPRPPTFLRHFREKCRDVQRVALGMCVQLSGDPRGQLPHTQRVGESLDLARRKGRKPNGRSRPSTRHPVESLRKPGDALAALRENGEHTLPDEAADHEQQRPEGVDVGPVRVVDRRQRRAPSAHRSSSASRIRAPDPDRLLGGQNRSRLASSLELLTPAIRINWSTTP